MLKINNKKFQITIINNQLFNNIITNVINNNKFFIIIYLRKYLYNCEN